MSPIVQFNRVPQNTYYLGYVNNISPERENARFFACRQDDCGDFTARPGERTYYQKMVWCDKKGGELSPRRGRPSCGALGSFPDWIAAQIDEWRPNAEGWGPITIRAELERLDKAKELELPCTKSISSYLKSKGRNRNYRKKSCIADTKMELSLEPHHIWQMDAEGNKDVAEIGRVGFINIKDTFSKIFTQAFPLKCRSSKSHAKRSDYQLALRLAWAEFGRCRILQLDHESVYYDNTHQSPFPTKMHLWLIGMDVGVVFTPKGKPQQQGTVERSHQTIDTQTCYNHSCADWSEFLNRVAQRRYALNNYIPSRVLGGQSPLQACPHEYHRSTKPYQMEQELEIFDEQRVINYLVSCKDWQRKVDGRRCIQIGGNSYFLNDARPNQQLNIRVSRNRMLEFRLPGDEQVAWTKPLRGYLHEQLGGELKQHLEWARRNKEFIKIGQFGKGHD